MANAALAIPYFNDGTSRGAGKSAGPVLARAATLVNELAEAKHQLQLTRVMARWSGYDLIAIDEVGYVPLVEVGAQFLFHVVAPASQRSLPNITRPLTSAD